VLKLLQHDKIWGDNPPAPKFGGLVPPVIYAHVDTPKTTWMASFTLSESLPMKSSVETMSGTNDV